MSDPDRLDSWKDIAGHLKKDIRTCQRWHAEYGLPVHRYIQSSRSRVFAYKAEIDEWLRSGTGSAAEGEEGRPKEAAKRPKGGIGPVVLAVAPVLICAIYLGFGGAREPRIAAVDAAGTKIRLLDAEQKTAGEWDAGSPLNGNFFWDLRAKKVPSPDSGPRFDLVEEANFRAYRGKEYLISILKEGPSIDTLVCLSGRGKKRWIFEPHTGDFGIEGGRLAGSDVLIPIIGFRVGDLDGDGREEVVVLSALHDESRARIDVLNEKGERKFGFLNPGMLKDFALADVDGDPAVEILAAGYFEPEGVPALVVIDPAKMSENEAEKARAAADEEGRERAGGESGSWAAEIRRAERYILFPNTDIETALSGRNILGKVEVMAGEAAGTIEVCNLLRFRLVLGKGLMSVRESTRFRMEFVERARGMTGPNPSLESYLAAIEQAGVRYLK
jgi:hypothetical protein